jgi:phage terminase large subunit
MARKRLAPARRLASYDPHPHQITFHQDTHKYRAIVSGVGAGKTRMGVEEVIKWTQLFPGSLGVIGRLTAKSLKETTQRRFFEVCDPKIIEAFNQSDGHVWIKTNEVDENGDPVYSEILFMHLDDPGPLGSLDISYFWIDEAHEPDGTEVPEATFDMLTARLRHPIGPHRGFLTSNSGGKDWVWDKFFNPAKRKIMREYVGWTVPTRANAKYLPPGYVEELTRTHTKTWVDRFLNASFDAFEGQIFTEFVEGFHTFRPNEVDISPFWEHGAGFDFGISAPTACEYGCLDRDGRLIVYDEDYQPEADVPDFAIRMKKKGFDVSYADPSVVNRGPNKKSPKQLYQEEGVCLIPASNDEDFFITYFIQLLRARMPDGSPKVLISTKCEHLIDQIKQAAWDPKTITGTTHDKVKKMENHAIDAFKYLVNGMAFQPGELTPVVPHGNSKKDTLTINGEWEHESYLDDEDLDSEKYCHPEIKEAISDVLFNH